MTTALIAVDGSDLDREILVSARTLFGDDADYVVVNVGEHTMAFAAVPLGYGFTAALSTPEMARLADGIATTEEDAENIAERAAQQAGLDHATPVGEVGDPVSVVLRAAEEHGADVIVVGTRHRSWFSRLFDPSVSNAITQLARVPVLIVHGVEDSVD